MIANGSTCIKLYTGMGSSTTVRDLEDNNPSLKGVVIEHVPGCMYENSVIVFLSSMTTSVLSQLLAISIPTNFADDSGSETALLHRDAERLS